MKIAAKVSEETAKKLGITSEAVEVEVDIPASLAEKVTKFGEDVVNGAVEDSLVISVQALMRRMMVPKTNKEGKVTKTPSSREEIQKAVDEWKPDVRSVIRQSAFERATSTLEKMTPEERKALLAKLQAM